MRQVNRKSAVVAVDLWLTRRQREVDLGRARSESTVRNSIVLETQLYFCTYVCIRIRVWTPLSWCSALTAGIELSIGADVFIYVSLHL
jgi:hypothetical protein